MLHIFYQAFSMLLQPGSLLAMMLGMAIGLIFRLILAYGIDGLRGSGFGADLGLFNYWADTLAQHGPWGFYALHLEPPRNGRVVGHVLYHPHIWN